LEPNTAIVKFDIFEKLWNNYSKNYMFLVVISQILSLFEDNKGYNLLNKFKIWLKIDNFQKKSKKT